MTKKHTVLAVFRVIFDVFRAVVILAAILIGLLYAFGIRPYVVQTGSMEPTIPVASVCFVNHHSDYEKVKVNDVIAFRIGENTLVTHRAISIDIDGIITKGDANEAEDAAKVTAGNFVGNNLFHIPKIGVVFFFLRTLWGKVAFGCFSAFLLLIGHILDNLDVSEKESAENNDETILEKGEKHEK